VSTSLLDLSNALADTVRAAGAGLVRVDARRRHPASGILWAADGLVVTASHVVRRDEDITVGLPDGRSVPAALVGRDPTLDLALLRAQASDLSLPSWSDGADLAVGQLVLALGRPGAEPEASLGSVTALGGRWMTAAGGWVDRFVRVSVEMLPGFSGGPLVGASGEVLGLLTSGLSREGGLVLPTTTVRRVAGELATHGRVRRGYLGISANPVQLPAELAGDGPGVGLMIAAVEPDSPAAAAGLALGDVLLAIDGQPVRRMEGLLAHLDGERIGQPVTLRVLRGGQPRDIAVTLGERPAEG
jgi:S1-C subfamily serine protease